MLKIYLSSIIIWFIILSATDIILRKTIKNKDINYKKYIKNKQNNIQLSKNIGKNTINALISFIPILRLILWVAEVFLIVADEKMLDEIFKIDNKEE